MSLCQDMRYYQHDCHCCDAANDRALTVAHERDEQ